MRRLVHGANDALALCHTGCFVSGDDTIDMNHSAAQSAHKFKISKTEFLFIDVGGLPYCTNLRLAGILDSTIGASIFR